MTLADTLVDTPTADVRDLYARNGIRSVCFAPMIFRDEPVGLLVLYQDAVHAWSDEETALARGLADQMATAVGNARLNDSVQLARGAPRGGPGPGDPAEPDPRPRPRSPS